MDAVHDVLDTKVNEKPFEDEIVSEKLRAASRAVFFPRVQFLEQGTNH